MVPFEWRSFNDEMFKEKELGEFIRFWLYGKVQSAHVIAGER